MIFPSFRSFFFPVETSPARPCLNFRTRKRRTTPRRNESMLWRSFESGEVDNFKFHASSFFQKSIKKQTMIFSNGWSVCRSGYNSLETGVGSNQMHPRSLQSLPNLATVNQCDAIEWPKPLPSESGKTMINHWDLRVSQTHFQRHFMPRHASPFPTCRAVKGDSNNLKLTVMTLAPWLYVWCVWKKRVYVFTYYIILDIIL